MKYEQGRLRLRQYVTVWSFAPKIRTQKPRKIAAQVFRLRSFPNASWIAASRGLVVTSTRGFDIPSGAFAKSPGSSAVLMSLGLRPIESAGERILIQTPAEWPKPARRHLNPLFRDQLLMQRRVAESKIEQKFTLKAGMLKFSGIALRHLAVDVI
jgi:hypothetical protein